MAKTTFGVPDDVRPISVDDHIIEPPHLWQDRLPARDREVGPRVVELDDGTQAWRFEDQVIRTVRGNSRTREGFDPDPNGWARFDEMRPGCYDPKARLADMDADGVWAQVAFPDFSRFAGHRFINARDPALAIRCVEAYNDFAIDEWCATDPERLGAVAILPFWDVPAAVAEVARIAARGPRAFAFSENPTTLGLPSVYTSHWEPLWSAIADTGLPVCLHIGSSSKLLRSSDDAPPPVCLTFVGANSMMACADWLFSGILERHPQLQVAFSEGGAGWVPYVLERADEVFTDFPDVIVARRPPRELFAEHMHVCMLKDDTALAALDVIPNDNIMWESDYPHESGTFPHSRARLERSLARVPTPIAAKIAETNARRLFAFR
ncbi:MAG TPA: amidohydrolase family protein [Acidimicrobiales bacterium]|jgi:predicted TIM-barrel fold metal-dependent hydrolase|nr:amidohydrolase family protein [Acidimicrobiales bacterium]